MKRWSSKTKLFCETSFKNEALKFKNEAFLRDFLQKRSFEDQKWSFSARLPSNWSFEAQRRIISARLPSKMKLWSSKTKLFCETSFKNDVSTRHLTSESQYVLAIFNWMLQTYCACHEKVEPRHTNSCNCHAKWSLQSNIRDVKFATFPRIQRRRLRTSTSQSAKSLRLPRETHRFRPSSNPPRLPTFLQPSRTPAPATYFATRRNPCACHAKRTFNLQKRPEHLVF